VAYIFVRNFAKFKNGTVINDLWNKLAIKIPATPPGDRDNGGNIMIHTLYTLPPPSTTSQSTGKKLDLILYT
jgi:hypothetical protein